MAFAVKPLLFWRDFYALAVVLSQIPSDGLQQHRFRFVAIELLFASAAFPSDTKFSPEAPACFRCCSTEVDGVCRHFPYELCTVGSPHGVQCTPNCSLTAQWHSLGLGGAFTRICVDHQAERLTGVE